MKYFTKNIKYNTKKSLKISSKQFKRKEINTQIKLKKLIQKTKKSFKYKTRNFQITN